LAPWHPVSPPIARAARTTTTVPGRSTKLWAGPVYRLKVILPAFNGHYVK
jgi:hypothetical protein